MSAWELFGLILLVVVLGSYLMMLVSVVADIMRDHTLGGVAKAVWLAGLVLMPVAGLLVYLIARGDEMSERNYQRHHA